MIRLYYTQKAFDVISSQIILEVFLLDQDYIQRAAPLIIIIKILKSK